MLKYAVEPNFYFKVKIKRPTMINPPPSAIFQLNCSFKTIKDNSNVMIMLPLSINATCETLPILMAL